MRGCKVADTPLSATLQSGRYTLSYLRDVYTVCLNMTSINPLSAISMIIIIINPLTAGASHIRVFIFY